MPREQDLIVIGAGGCGLAAAISAAEVGLRVTVFEKEPEPGGNTAYSVGSVPGAGTRFQEEAGIQDSPALFVEDLVRQTQGECDRDRVDRLTQNSAPLVHWLVDSCQVPLSLTQDYKHVGHSVNRLHNPPSREGRELIRQLVEVAERLDVQIHTSAPVLDLQREDAAWTAVVETEHGSEPEHAGQIVLATDGFGASYDLKNRYCPEVAEMAYIGAPGNDGDGLRFGLHHGAAVENMESYLAYALMAQRGNEAPTYETLFSWTVPEMGGVIVNRNGERFANEEIGYSGFAMEIQRQADGVGFVVFDERVREYVAKYEQRFRLLCEGSDSPINVATDLDELAAAEDLPADRLRRTIARYNESASGQRNDPQGRQTFGKAPLKPPYCIAHTVPGLLTTQGGLRVNLDAQVVRSDGSLVEGLYAGGSTAAGISGTEGGYGYVSGNGLLTALGWGFIAGRHAAESR